MAFNRLTLNTRCAILTVWQIEIHSENDLPKSKKQRLTINHFTAILCVQLVHFLRKQYGIASL
jgi:hypothetical protein